MENMWIQTNNKLLETIKRMCIEHDMKGGYGGELPLRSIIQLFDSAKIEINRLQKEMDEMNKIIEDMKKEKIDIVEDIIKD